MDKIIKILVRFYPVFLKGLGGTLWLAAATVLFGTVLGLVIAILRMSRIRVFNAVAGVYIEILRGTPILLQLYFFWLMLPKIMPFQMSDTAAILVALMRSLGLSETNMMRKIILPQAVKNILPALCNEFIAEVKGTSLASVFFIPELTTSYRTVQSTTFLSIQPLLIAGMIYLFVTTVLSWAVRRMERRLKASD